MTKYWEDNMIIKVYNNIISKKDNIIIGKNHHYRLVSKKLIFRYQIDLLLTLILKKKLKIK